jgi:hypothetical protein
MCVSIASDCAYLLTFILHSFTFSISGLMTAIHCTEAVLMSGGTMRLTEARDAFAQGGATFERAQIVRLDARWIGMLRYHLVSNRVLTKHIACASID